MQLQECVDSRNFSIFRIASGPNIVSLINSKSLNKRVDRCVLVRAAIIGDGEASEDSKLVQFGFYCIARCYSI